MSKRIFSTIAAPLTVGIGGAGTGIGWLMTQNKENLQFELDKGNSRFSNAKLNQEQLFLENNLLSEQIQNIHGIELTSKQSLPSLERSFQSSSDELSKQENEKQKLNKN